MRHPLNEMVLSHLFSWRRARRFLAPIFIISAFTPALWASQAAAEGCASQDAAAQLIKRARDAQSPAESRTSAFEKAVELCPNELSLYVELTTLLVKTGRGQDALSWTQRGLSRWPGNADLSRNLGVALLAEGRAREALEVLTKLPPDAQTAFELGMAYRALGDHSNARKELASAYAAGQKDPYLLYALIQEDRALGDREGGVKDFITLEHDFPDSAWVYLLMGDAYLDRHDAANAMAEYRAAVAAQPSMAVVHFNLGRLAFDRGDYREAETDFREETRLDPSFADAHLYLGETLIRQARNAEAIDELKQAIALNPNSALAYQALATAEEAGGQPDAAFAVLRDGQTRFPQDAAFPAQQARLLSRQGRTAEAAQQSALAEELSRRNNPMHYSGEASPGGTSTPSPASGRVVTAETPLDPAETDLALSGLRRCVEKRDVVCAEAELEKIHEGRVLNTAAYLELKAQTLVLGHRTKEALASASAAAEKNPNDPAAWLTLGHLQQAAGDQDSAIHSFLEAQRMQPHSAPTMYSLGMSFFLLGLDTNVDDYYQRAARHFRLALEIDPKQDRAVFMLGVIAAVESKLSEGRSYMEKAMALSPQNPYYHLELGVLLDRMGEAEKAVDEMIKAERLDPANPQCHLSLGEIYARQNDFEAARKELERAVQLNPHLAPSYYALGGVYRHLGLKTEAETAYTAFQKEKDRESKGDTDPVSEAIQGNSPKGSAPR
jgi:tetratricopeptide (TPR) repeat protein